MRISLIVGILMISGVSSLDVYRSSFFERYGPSNDRNNDKDDQVRHYSQNNYRNRGIRHKRPRRSQQRGGNHRSYQDSYNQGRHPYDKKRYQDD